MNFVDCLGEEYFFVLDCKCDDVISTSQYESTKYNVSISLKENNNM